MKSNNALIVILGTVTLDAVQLTTTRARAN